MCRWTSVSGELSCERPTHHCWPLKGLFLELTLVYSLLALFLPLPWLWLARFPPIFFSTKPTHLFLPSRKDWNLAMSVHRGSRPGYTAWLIVICKWLGYDTQPLCIHDNEIVTLKMEVAHSSEPSNHIFSHGVETQRRLPTGQQLLWKPENLQLS
jgi:hypothetical protein